jgi:DNA-binding response OmpR family regulator
MAKILIINDSSQQLKAVAASLRRAGIEVLEASCIPGGLETARSGDPDLIVSIEGFPDLDVLDLLEIKRHEQAMNDIGVVIVSGSAVHKLECFKLGCDDFITLPAEDAELFFRICALLRRIGSKGVRGSFADISILDLIQMLVAARRSGRLSLEFREANAQLLFQDGQVCHAVFGQALGEEAFLSILKKAQHGGTFTFSAEDAGTYEKSIDKRTDHLLLALANLLDEENVSSNA